MRHNTRTIGGSLWLAALLLGAVGCSNDSGKGNSGAAGTSGAAGSSGGSSASGSAGSSGGSKSGGSGGTSSAPGGAGGSSLAPGGAGAGGSSLAPGGAGAGGSSLAPGGAGAGGKSSTGSTGGRTGGTVTGGAAGTDTATGGAGAGGTSNATSTTRTGGSGGGTTGPGGSSGGSAGGQSSTSVPQTCSGPAPTGTNFTVDAGGVNFTVGTGKMYVQVCADDIIRVQYTGAATLPKKTSLSVSNPWDKPPSFCVTQSESTITITTAKVKAKVDTSKGLVSYTDLQDKAIVAESSKGVSAVTVEGTATNRIDTVFTSTADEALFGLGQQENSPMNRKSQSNLRLENGNKNIYIPVLVSNKGYGLFWDNASIGTFRSAATTTSYSSECGDMVDYYFFYGPTIDQVVAAYRTTTGTPPLFPKWAYGLFQSKDHYTTQTELTTVMNGYLNANIPVDVIVQDWQYWDPDSWGSHIMYPTKYPDPKGLLTTMHSKSVHGMISIWPEYQKMTNAPDPTDQDNYKALDAIGALLANNGSDYHFYDVFNDKARTLVYQQQYDRLIGKYGWDAIWADNTEPQNYPGGALPSLHAAKTALGPGALNLNAYPLQHARALYEGWRKVGPSDKRIYVLTRSGWAGTQRFGAAVWSGDIDSSVETYGRQIIAGLNYALSGMPYWTTDIGGYTGTPTDEVFTRWFQFGAFCSQFRIHGQATKELYGWKDATTKANALAADVLHYRLMPYIYSLAWKTTSESYTIMRHLVFDYQNDSKVFDIKDQFMYGPALLVSPVTSAGATSRSVYLPAGTWYDFWTGASATGGANVTAETPLSHLSIFVKAGSILPMGPKIQHATDKADPLEIRIYKGANGSFTLYDDAGDTYDYETGKYATITLTWDDAAGKLTVGARKGSYTGMLETRTFNVVLVGADHGVGADVTATADKTITYDGSETSANLK